MRKRKREQQNYWIVGICLLVGLLMLAATFVKMLASNQTIKGTSSFSASEIISLTNAVRQQHGLTPLHPQAQLMKAAEAKVNAMMATNSWDHNTPTQTPWQFLDNEQYIYVVAGENLAKGFLMAEDVVNGWMKSPSHRENILNPAYTDTGVAVIEGTFQGKNTTLVVQYLAKAYVPTDNISEPPQFITPPTLVKKVALIPPLYFVALFLLTTVVLAALAVTVLVKQQRLPKMPDGSFWHR